MFSGGNLSQFNKRNFFIWMLLSFQAGTINVGGFLACHRFVSHTTGFATFFGAGIANHDVSGALGMIIVPIFFLIGTMISAFLVDRSFVQGTEPHSQIVLFLMALLNTIVLLAGVNGYFGEFGSEFKLERDFAILALLCLSSGIQNASISSASKNAIRTTHLTGNTTDLGIGLVRIWFHKNAENRDQDIKFVWTRVSIITFFILGSTLAAFTFVRNQYWGFAFPAVISTALWLYSLKKMKRITK